MEKIRNQVKRISVIVLVLAMALFGSCDFGMQVEKVAEPAIEAGEARALASTGAKFLGNIIKKMDNHPANWKTYWNYATPEYKGLWYKIEATRDVMDWSGMDAIYDWCQANGVPLHEAHFIWGYSEPSWLAGLSAAEIRAEIDE